MIDFNYANKRFKEYLKDYDCNDGMIGLKIRHTYGVVSSMEYLVDKLNLDDENKELAKVIALLHDIARFEQAKEFGDFRDYKSIDHAELAIKILFEDNLIKVFVKSRKYDEIIKYAIKNHNKLYIEDELVDDTLLHAKLIRDADKLDNFRVKYKERFEDIFNSSKDKIENSIITDKIYNDFISNKVIVNKERVTDADVWISYLAMIFDFNFIDSLKYIKENDYINKLIDRLDFKIEDTRNKMNIIREHANNFIKLKVGE